MANQVRDGRLRGVVDESATLDQLAGDFRFTEGPIWHPREEHLTFSDIPGNRLYRWSEAGGLSVLREPSNMANGNTYDGEGRMLTCEHATSRVTRTQPDGGVVVLASHYQGKELNSPNDIVVRRDGTVWFTDPTYERRRGGLVMRTIATIAALMLSAAVNAQTVDICDRTPQVRDAILEVLDADDCAAVDSESLAGVETLNIASGEWWWLDLGREWYLTALRAADFDGLTGLKTLRLNYNRLTTLPAGVFDGLTSLLV